MQLFLAVLKFADINYKFKGSEAPKARPYFLRLRRFSVRKHWKSTFLNTPLSFDAHSPENPREYPHKTYISKTYISYIYLITWKNFDHRNDSVMSAENLRQQICVWGMSARMCLQSFVELRCVIKKALGVFRELIRTTTRTTEVAFLRPAFRMQKSDKQSSNLWKYGLVKTIGFNPRVKNWKVTKDGETGELTCRWRGESGND